MAKRDDKFRPSVIDPTKFEFVAQHYLGPISDDFAMTGICEELAAEQANLEAHQAAHPGYTVAGHKWVGQCDCCGARYMWGATFHTNETNTYISIGGICAGKLRLGSPEAMKTFREQVNTWKVHQERVAKARAYLTTVNLVAMLEMWLSKTDAAERELSDYDRFPYTTLRDMCGKVVQWGNELSEKQQNFAHKLLAQIADRPAREAARAAKDAARKDIPAFIKRVTIEGVIVSAKYSEGGWRDERGNERNFFQPDSVKIVIEHADGWKVWGTAPSELLGFTGYNAEGKYIGVEERAAQLKGKRVRLDARVTVSDKDPKFGFFKRPTKAALLVETVNPDTLAVA
jgi:hypothetical protein